MFRLTFKSDMQDTTRIFFIDGQRPIAKLPDGTERPATREEIEKASRPFAIEK